MNRLHCIRSTISEQKSMNFLFNKIRISGFTLIELMIGLAAASLVFLMAGSIFVRGVDLSSFFFRNAAVMEQMSDGITQLSAVMPQVVHIRSCNCSGNTATESSCSWSPASEWNDPVFDVGLPGNGTANILFDADYDNGYGGSGLAGAQYLAADQTLTSYYPGGMGCEGAHPGGITNHGCRRRLRLVYIAPIQEVGSVPSRPGVLQLQLNDTGWAGGSPQKINIGLSSGVTTSASAASQAGLVRLSCGFATPTAGQIGTDFVINLRAKVKSSGIETVSSSSYESWHPSGTRYNQGLFREAKLRFTFLNLSQRGAYQWKMQSTKTCKVSGQAATNREQCCSLALGASGQCLATCKPKGNVPIATSASECCSEKFVAGDCI